MFFFTLIFSCSVAAQDWNFIKEKNGIKIYTRVEAGKSLRSYKGVTDINAPAKKIFALMEDINNTDWWDKERKINIVALNGVIPEHNGLVRIKDYRQIWTITPSGKELSHIVLEGYVDPAGIIPNFISNALIIESPFKVISNLREALQKKQINIFQQ